MLDNNPPEELSTETLTSVSVVLTAIQEAAKKDVSTKKLKTFPFEIKTQEMAGLPINPTILKNAERSKAEILRYLKAQGAIEEVIMQPLTNNSSIRPDFLVTIKPDYFREFCDKTLRLMVLRVEAAFSLDKSAQRTAKDVITTDAPNRNIPLPKVILKLGDDFAVHESHIISYKNQQIPLELQIAKLVAFIMERSANNSFTTSSHLAATILDDNRNYEEPEKYIAKMISDARRQFKGFTKTDHDYFPNSRGRGYLFQY